MAGGQDCEAEGEEGEGGGFGDYGGSDVVDLDVLVFDHGEEEGAVVAEFDLGRIADGCAEEAQVDGAGDFGGAAAVSGAEAGGVVGHDDPRAAVDAEVGVEGFEGIDAIVIDGVLEGIAARAGVDFEDGSEEGDVVLAGVVVGAGGGGEAEAVGVVEHCFNGVHGPGDSAEVGAAGDGEVVVDGPRGGDTTLECFCDGLPEG